MRTIQIPQQLTDAVDEDDYPARHQWLAALPDQVDEIASDWALELGDAYVPSGQCAWVAPARNRAGDDLGHPAGRPTASRLGSNLPIE